MKNEFFAEVLGGLSTAVIWVDSDRKIQYMNVAASELFQLGESRAIGKEWRYLLPNLDVELVNNSQQKVTVHEYAIETPGFERIRVSCRITPYQLNQKKGWLIELYDNERHHRIIEEDERWHQYEAGNLLVKTLAHEVKNPLAGILGATQLLQKRHQGEQKELAFLDVISKEVIRLKNLVDRMLGPGSSATKEPHNIHLVIRHILQVIAGEKPDNVAIKLDYDPSIPEITMDFDAMVQAMMNLVKNGIQAMRNTGGFLTIRTRVEHKFTLGSKTYPLVAVISIKDEGEGIPENVFDSIFYPMVTSKKEGTGLGLPVSQNVLRQHGGLIVAESEPGRTVFSVYLPINLQENNNEH
jgi:two-component system nitrogen regulation sensor histidine kinase GlnL